MFAHTDSAHPTKIKPSFPILTTLIKLNVIGYKVVNPSLLTSFSRRAEKFHTWRTGTTHAVKLPAFRRARRFTKTQRTQRAREGKKNNKFVGRESESRRNIIIIRIILCYITVSTFLNELLCCHIASTHRGWPLSFNATPILRHFEYFLSFIYRYSVFYTFVSVLYHFVSQNSREKLIHERDVARQLHTHPLCFRLRA